MSSWSDFQVTQFFATLPASPYLGLHYANPALGGFGLAEVTGGSYARQALPLSAPQARAVYNTSPALFTGLSSISVSWLGIWDALSGGNLVAQIQVLPAIAVSNGGQFPVNVGDIALVF